MSEGVPWCALEPWIEMRTVSPFEAVDLRTGRRCEVKITWPMWLSAMWRSTPVSSVSW